MNLLFMQNGLPPYGIPRSGLISIIDPWRDLYGRNILMTGTDNFSTNWATLDGATVTVTPNQPDPFGGNNAYRLQVTVGAGTSSEKYRCESLSTVPIGSVVWGKLWVKANSGSYKITLIDRSTERNNTVWQPFIYQTTLTAIRQYLMFITAASPTSTIDVTVYQPQVNLGQLCPYSPPAGLPQSLTDYTGLGNNAQLGSAAGADTNDPAWSGNGLTFGTDDYAKSNSSVFDDMQQFTCITCCKIITQSYSQRIFDKTKSLDNYSGSALRLPATRKLSYTQYNPSGGSTYKNWESNDTIDTNNHILSVAGVRSLTDDAIKMFIDSNPQTITTSTAGTMILSSNVGNPLYIGNRFAADLAINGGTIYLQLWYNRVLSDAEYMQAYNGLRRLMSSRGVVI